MSGRREKSPFRFRKEPFVFGLPLVFDLFGKAQQVADLQHRAVVEHGHAGEAAEDLILVALDQPRIRSGRAVENRMERHLKAAVVAGEQPRAEVILFALLHRDMERHLRELMRFSGIEKHIFAGG